MIVASDFRVVAKNTLRGFVTLTLAPSGIVLRECSLHEKDGKRWIGLPSKPQLDPEGRHRIDTAGKRMYVPIVEIAGKDERARFQQAAVAAVDKLLGRGAAP
jgi:hypothetical protein